MLWATFLNHYGSRLILFVMEWIQSNYGNKNKLIIILKTAYGNKYALTEIKYIFLSLVVFVKTFVGFILYKLSKHVVIFVIEGLFILDKYLSYRNFKLKIL